MDGYRRIPIQRQATACVVQRPVHLVQVLVLVTHGMRSDASRTVGDGTSCMHVPAYTCLRTGQAMHAGRSQDDQSAVAVDRFLHLRQQRTA